MGNEVVSIQYLHLPSRPLYNSEDDYILKDEKIEGLYIFLKCYTSAQTQAKSWIVSPRPQLQNFTGPCNGLHQTIYIKAIFV